MKLAKDHKKIYNAIFQQDDLRWQSLIYEMIRSGKVDPWNIDISLFSKEYLKRISEMKELNFRISGKIVLTAAILLKMKTNRLGLQQFLGMLEEPEEEPEPGIDGFEQEQNPVEQRIEKIANHIKHNSKKPKLQPRLDRQKERKVTVFELMTALKKAMEVDQRRKKRTTQIKEQMNKRKEYKIKKFDIAGRIEKVYKNLLVFIKKNKKNTAHFSKIVPSKKKKDIIWTFVPLLHLANENKVDLIQNKPFGDLYVQLKDKNLLIQENNTKNDK